MLIASTSSDPLDMEFSSGLVSRKLLTSKRLLVLGIKALSSSSKRYKLRKEFCEIASKFDKISASYNEFQKALDEVSDVEFEAKLSDCVSRRRHRCLEKYPLQVRHKQNWGRGFILLLPQTAALPESDAGLDVIKPASSFVIQNRQTSCSMWCPMYRARC